MDIANLLAQGTRARPAGMEQNALMQYQQFQDAKLRNALMQTQMQAAQEKQAQDRQNALLQQNLIDSIPSPQMQASQSALAGGGGPTVANAAQMKPVDPRLQMLHQAMQARMVSPVDYINAANPKTEAMTVAPGASVVDKANPSRVLFTAPDKSKDDAFVGLMKQAGIDPASPQGQSLLAARLQKESTHTPPVSIANYGSPVPVDLGGGKIGYVQPANKAGAPPQMMADPKTNQPFLKPGDEGKPPTEFQAKAGLYFKSMQTASQVLERIDARGGADAKPTLAEVAAPEAGKEFLRSAGRKAYVQAQMQWIDSINRVRSGANLPEIEYDRAVKTFFPTANDGLDQIKQKAAARKQEEQAMAVAAGPALKGYPQSKQDRQVVRTGTLNGRKVVQYSDGSTEYAD